MKTPGSIIKNPRVTEKAAILSEARCYTFNVAKSVSKKEIAQAIKALYKVTPLKVRTVSMPTKLVMPRGGRGNIGQKGGGKKAYVYLKKGDKIEVL